jgi:hypothetical protein
MSARAEAPIPLDKTHVGPRLRQFRHGQLISLADYLTRPELAAELLVTPSTLDRWAERGEGPPVTKMGNKPLYHRPAVAAWLLAQQVA